MKINVIRQDSLKYARARQIRLVNSIIMFGSLALFVLSILIVSGRYIYYAVRLNSLNEEAAQLNTLYRSRAEETFEYLAVKRIVGAVSEIQASRFRYKEFLDAVFGLLPPGTALAEVSFSTTGVIVVGVRLPSLSDYDLLLANLESVSSGEGFLFSEVAEKGLSRGKTGSYLVTMELTIKNGKR